MIEIVSPATKRLLGPLHFSDSDVLVVSTYQRDKKQLTLKITSNGDSGFTAPSYSTTTWLRRFPERSGSEHDAKYGDGVRVPATDLTALMIAAWPSHQVRFADEVARLTCEVNLLRLARQTSVYEHVARFFATGQVDGLPLDFEDHPENPLTSYQLAALRACLWSEGYSLFMEQGTGKTPVVISRICHESKHSENGKYRVLVVCPKNVRLNWSSEFDRFATTPGRVTVLRGGKLKRTKLLVDALSTSEGEKWSVVIASYDGVVRTFDTLALIPWDLVVLDESHYVKSPNAQRTRSLLKFRDFGRQRMNLTGTPVTNHGGDLWPQLEFMHEGASGFHSYKNFKRYFNRLVDQGNYELVLGPNMDTVPLLQERMLRYSFRIDKKTAMPYLPEKTYDAVEVDMTVTQREMYVALQKKLIIEIEEMIAASEQSGKRLMVSNVLVKLLRLAQITSGFVSWDPVPDEDERTLEPLEPNPKIDALLSMLSEKGPNQKTIVWCTFVQDVRRVCRALNDAGIRHVAYYGSMPESALDESVQSFNCDPSVKVLVGNPAKGREGINLWGYDPRDIMRRWEFADNWKTSAHVAYEDVPRSATNCDHVIYFSQNWSLSHRSQSEDRSHRKFTRTSVRYTDLVIPGTIDQEIRRRVVLKRENAEIITDVRDLLSRVFCDVNGEREND